MDEYLKAFRKARAEMQGGSFSPDIATDPSQPTDMYGAPASQYSDPEEQAIFNSRKQTGDSVMDMFYLTRSQLQIEDLRRRRQTEARAQENLANRSEFTRGLLRGLDTLQATYEGGVGMYNAAMGDQAAAEERFRNYREQMRQAQENPATVTDFFSTDPKTGAFASPGNFGTYVAGTLGQAVPSLTEAVASGIAGAAIGAAIVPAPDPADVVTIPAGAIGGFLGRNAMKRAIASAAQQYAQRGVAQDVAEQMADRYVRQAVANRIATNVGSGLAVSQTTALHEGGGMWAEGMEKGYNAPGTAIALGQVSGLSESLFGAAPTAVKAIIGKTAVDEVAKKSGWKAAAGYLWDAIKGSGKEGAQEGFQEFLGSVNQEISDPNFKITSKETFMQWAEAAAAGALVGGVVSGGAAGLEGARTSRDATPDADVSPFGGDADNVEPSLSEIRARRMMLQNIVSQGTVSRRDSKEFGLAGKGEKVGEAERLSRAMDEIQRLQELEAELLSGSMQPETQPSPAPATPVMGETVQPPQPQAGVWKKPLSDNVEADQQEAALAQTQAQQAGYETSEIGTFEENGVASIGFSYTPRVVPSQPQPQQPQPAPESVQPPSPLPATSVPAADSQAAPSPVDSANPFEVPSVQAPSVVSAQQPQADVRTTEFPSVAAPSAQAGTFDLPQQPAVQKRPVRKLGVDPFEPQTTAGIAQQESQSSTPSVAQQPEEGTKELWQTTSDNIATDANQPFGESLLNWAKAVRKAIADGKDVPAEVRRDLQDFDEIGAALGETPAPAVTPQQPEAVTPKTPVQTPPVPEEKPVGSGQPVDGIAEQPAPKNLFNEFDNIEELYWKLENWSADEQRPKESYTTKELLAMARERLEDFAPGSGYEISEELAGEKGPELQKAARKQVKRIEAWIKRAEKTLAKEEETAAARSAPVTPVSQPEAAAQPSPAPEQAEEQKAAVESEAAAASTGKKSASQTYLEELDNKELAALAKTVGIKVSGRKKAAVVSDLLKNEKIAAFLERAVAKAKAEKPSKKKRPASRRRKSEPSRDMPEEMRLGGAVEIPSSKFNASERKQESILERLGIKLRLIKDGDRKIPGLFIPSSRTVWLDRDYIEEMNARWKKKGRSDEAMTWGLFSHEMFHAIKEFTPKAWNRLYNWVSQNDSVNLGKAKVSYLADFVDLFEGQLEGDVEAWVAKDPKNRSVSDIKIPKNASPSEQVKAVREAMEKLSSEAEVTVRPFTVRSAEYVEEVLADKDVQDNEGLSRYLEDRAGSFKFWDKLGEGDPGLLARVGRWIRKVFGFADPDAVKPNTLAGQTLAAIERAMKQHSVDMRGEGGRRASPERNVFDATKVDVAEIRAKDRPGKRVSKGLSEKTVAGRKVLEESEDLSLIYVKKNAPKVFIKNASILANYPVVAGKRKFGSVTTLDQAQEVYDVFIRQVADNLTYLYSRYKPNLRELSTLWYDGANSIINDMADRFKVTPEQVAGIVAAMSPQKDWYQNIRTAELLLEAFQANPTMSREMVDYQRDVVHVAGQKEISRKLRSAEKAYRKSKTKVNKESLESAKLRLSEAIEKGNNVIAMLESYIGKDLESVPDDIKPYVVRLHHEINTTKDYNVVAPDGAVIGVARNDDGEKSRLAWGSYGEIGKAVAIRLDGSPKSITRNLGVMHKIRNFYNNIIDPMSEDGDVTMDTHAIAAALLMPLSSNSVQVNQNFGSQGAGNSGPFGIKGLYYAFAEGYQLAAKENGLLPRQMQSATWDPVRGLFTDTFKSDKRNVAKASQIWESYRDGKATIDEARERIFEAAGGITDPTWARPVQDEPGESAQQKGKRKGSRKPGQADIGTSGGDTGRRASPRRNGKDATTAIRSRVGLDGRVWDRSQDRRTVGKYGVVASYRANENDWVESGVATPTFIELQKSADSVGHFVEAITAARESHGALGASVYVYPEEDYRNMRLFLTEDGKAGFALKDSGEAGITDIVSVFNTNGEHLGVSYSLIRLAVEEGGNVLDAFDTFLPKIYSANGFRAIARTKWNDEFAPDGWNKKDYESFNNGEPDVVFMAYDPQRFDIYRNDSGEGEVFDDYDKAVASQRSVAKKNYLGLEERKKRDAKAKRSGRRASVGRGDEDLRGDSGQDRPAPARGVRSESPSYGEPREGAVSYVGRHYSTKPQISLSGKAYGTGVSRFSGGESKRLGQSDDNRIKNRVYFYIDTAGEIKPEMGVGEYAHEVKLNNLYDPASKLIEYPGNDNDFESAVIDAGFDGYIAKPYGMAVLLGPQHTEVPVRRATEYDIGQAALKNKEISDETQVSDRKGERASPGREDKRGRPESTRDGRGRDQSRSYSPLAGAPYIKGATGPDPKLVSVAERYARDNGIILKRQAEYVTVDEDRAKRIADAYEQMAHDPQDPKVKEAYQELAKQTKAQYDALIADGYTFTFYDNESDPYAGNPSNAMRDLRKNKSMAVYGTFAGFGTEGVTSGYVEDNPLLADTGVRWKDQSGVERPVNYVELFRAVHDTFGHGLEGAGFRARGEENAWQAHVRLFTGSAIGAMTSGTRGQNSWLNYGPYGEKNRTAKVEDTIFADQKTGLMPEWTWTEGRAADMEEEVGESDLNAPDMDRQVRYAAPRKDVVKKLNSGKKIKLYRAMLLIDGKLYPPMSSRSKDDTGKLAMRPDEPIGQWMQSEEKPDLVPKTGRNAGKFPLQKPKGVTWAAYAPYFHASPTPLNDQFTASWLNDGVKRPRMVIVEVEVPASEMTSGYQAEGSSKRVGANKWNAGVVASKLSGGREVVLSRYLRINRIVPDAEVAKKVADIVNPARLSIPENVVTPQLRAELEKNGVRISPKGTKGEAIRYSARRSMPKPPAAIADTLSQKTDAEVMSEYKQKWKAAPSRGPFLRVIRNQVPSQQDSVAVWEDDRAARLFLDAIDSSPVVEDVLYRGTSSKEIDRFVGDPEVQELPRGFSTDKRVAKKFSEGAVIVVEPGARGMRIGGTAENELIVRGPFDIVSDEVRSGTRVLRVRQAGDAEQEQQGRAKAKKDFKHIDWNRLSQLGETLNPNEAGYIKPDGTLADFSGKREGGQPGTRSFDHREAGGTAGMQEVIAYGWVRMDENSGFLDIAKMPTPAQLSAITKMARRKFGEIVLDLEDGLGEWRETDKYYTNPRRRWSQEYPEGTKPQRIINDIKKFFGGDTPNALYQQDGATRYSPSRQEDKAYMDAVESGDMRAAQKLVNNAIEKAGEFAGGVSPVVYHGSPHADFYEFQIPSKGFNSTVFGSYEVSRNAAFFTADKEVASRYQSQGGRKGGSVRKFNVFGEMLDLRNGISDAQFNTLVENGVNSRWLSRTGASWELFDKEQDPDGTLVKALKKMGYDGAIIKDTDGESDFDSYVAFSPSQIKSADPVTYDDAGNVIPLSERFDDMRSDVRYSPGRRKKKDDILSELYEFLENEGIAKPKKAEPRTTSIKNRKTDELRAEAGFPPRVRPERESFESWEDEARRKYPTAKDRLRLIARAEKEPEKIGKIESAAIGQHITYLDNRREAGENVSDELLRTIRVANAVGTEAGRALVSRKAERFSDYSLAGLIGEHIRTVGQDPTEEQMREYAELADRIKKLEADNRKLARRLAKETIRRKQAEATQQPAPKPQPKPEDTKQGTKKAALVKKVSDAFSVFQNLWGGKSRPAVRRQVDSQSFSRWFGDSKVVDENGKPLVVYHGSPAIGFTEFDKTKINANDPDSMTNGFFFSSSESEADAAGKFPWGRPNAPEAQVRAFYISLQNPASRAEANRVGRELERSGFEEKYPTARSLKDATRMELQARGYDGVVFEPYAVPDRATFDRDGRVAVGKKGYSLKENPDGGVDLYDSNDQYITGYLDFAEAVRMLKDGTYIAFEPNQIKSATDNVGTFDAADPDIRYSPGRQQPTDAKSAADDVVAALREAGVSSLMELESQVRANIPNVSAEQMQLFKDAWDASVAKAKMESPIGTNPDNAALGARAKELLKVALELGYGAEKENWMEAVDAVHSQLSLEVPGITKYQTMQAISDYGVWRELDPEEIAVKTRAIRGKARQSLKIEDTLKAITQSEEWLKAGVSPDEVARRLRDRGLLPKATGQERATPDSIERDLISEFNKLKKTLPVPAESREGQLKSALSTAKTAANNRLEMLDKDIAALQDALKNRKPLVKPVAEKTELQPDAELANLRSQLEEKRRQRDELKAQYDKVFPSAKPKKGRKPLTDEQRLEAAMKMLRRQIDAVKADVGALESGTWAPAAKKPGVTSVRMEELKSELASLREIQKQARKASPVYQAKEEAKYWERYRKTQERRLAFWERRRDEAKAGRLPVPLQKRTITENEILQKNLEIEEMQYEAMIAIEKAKRATWNYGQWIGQGILEATSLLPKTLMLGMEMSFVLRQGVFYTYSQPIKAFNALIEAFPAVFSQRMALASMEDIEARPNYKEYVAADVDFTMAKGPQAKLEEMYQSAVIQWLDSTQSKLLLPLRTWAKLYSMAERGNRTFSNIMKADMYDIQKRDTLAAREFFGVNTDWTENDIKETGRITNIFSGRGTGLRGGNPWLDWLFLARRWTWSRIQADFIVPFQLVTPQWIGQWNADRGMRVALAKLYIQAMVGHAAKLAAAYFVYSLLAGDDEKEKPTIEFDLRSSDAFALKIRETRFKDEGGLMPAIVLASRILTGQTKTGTGEIKSIYGEDVQYGGQTAADFLINYGRYKLGTAPSAILEWISGRDAVGNVVKKTDIISSRITPLTYREIYAAESELGLARGTLAAIEAFFGVSVGTHGARTKYKKADEKERKKMFEQNLKGMDWDTPDFAYKDLLSESQVNQMIEQREAKKQSVVYAALANPQRKAYKSDEAFKQSVKERDEAASNLRKMGIDFNEARLLLLAYYKRQYGSAYEMRGGAYVPRESYTQRLRMLRKALESTDK